MLYLHSCLKVRKSRKKTLSWIIPKNERWGNFMYWKLPQRLFFGRIQDAIICFWDLLTFKETRHWYKMGSKILRSLICTHNMHEIFRIFLTLWCDSILGGFPYRFWWTWNRIRSRSIYFATLSLLWQLAPDVALLLILLLYHQGNSL